MTDPVWPTTLPLPLREGYGVNDQPPIVRTEMESGPAQVVRVATGYVSDFTVQLLIDSDQYKTLMSFWDYSAGAGADWFTMPLDSDGDIAWHRVRIKNGISRTPVRHNLYRASFEVETEDRVANYE